MKVCLLVLSFALLAGAQTASKSLVGEVTAIDASAKQFKVKGDDGSNYTVAVDESTSYLRLPLGEKDLKKAQKIAFSDISVGDRLLTSKTSPVKTVIIMTKADVAKKQERDRAEWQTRGIAGTVTSVNPDTKEITIDTHARDARTIVIDASAASFQRYAPDSVHFADAKPSSLAEVKAGDTLRALGTKSEDGTHFKAEESVFGSFQTIAATVISVDPASGEVRVTDLQTKKPVIVKANPSTMLRRLPEMTATMLARRMRGDAAGGPGAPGALGAPPEGRSPEGRGPGGAPGGFGRGGGRGGADLQQVLERAPQLALAELKKGDALIISSSKMADGAVATAFSIVAGVEPFLAAAPRTAGQVDLGSWNLSVGGPEQ